MQPLTRLAFQQRAASAGYTAPFWDTPSDSFREIERMGVVVWKMGRRVNFLRCHLLLQCHGVPGTQLLLSILSTEYGKEPQKDQRGWWGFWLSFQRNLCKRVITSVGKVGTRIACGMRFFSVVRKNTGFV